jgi:hypothetical protein
VPLNLEELRPSVEDVAILEQTRTGAASGMGGDDEVATFTETSRPTISQVEQVIDTAMDLILPQLGTTLPTDAAQLTQLHKSIKRVVALQAAIIIEGSFFREQYDEGTVSAWAAIIARLMPVLQGLTGIVVDGTDGGGVDLTRNRVYTAAATSVVAQSSIDDLYLDNLPD